MTRLVVADRVEPVTSYTQTVLVSDEDMHACGSMISSCALSQWVWDHVATRIELEISKVFWDGVKYDV